MLAIFYWDLGLYWKEHGVFKTFFGTILHILIPVDTIQFVT
jgi:hypothetical protein